MAVTDLDPGMVRLDQLGHPSAPTSELRLHCIGVPESARSRLVAAGVSLIDDEQDVVDAIVVSTRLGPDELLRVEQRLADQGTHTLVLAHTGAERLAAQLIRSGADAIIGEGNEDALLGLVDTARTPSSLLGSFERRFGAASGTGRGNDAATGLPDRRTFEQRIGGLSDNDEVPRVAICKVVSDRWTTPDPDPVVAVQKRRLAVALAHLASTVDAEVFATGSGEFGLVSESLSQHDIDRLGRQFVTVAASFRDRGLPLRGVVGHAGPESTSDPDELLELSRRAVEVAAADGAHEVLSAEELALGVSVTTELEAVIRLLDQIEPSLPEGRGHGERVGLMCAEFARLRGWSPAAVARSQLAGHLHDVGRAGLPGTAVAGPDGLSGEMLEAWRTFPARSAAMLRLTGGQGIADALRSQRERWDGEGFPDGIRSTDIPELARMLAIAHTIDELVVQGTGAATILLHLKERAGLDLDPELAEIAEENLAALLHARG